MNNLKLVNIGFGNMLNAEKIIAVVSPDSAPIKRIVGDAKDRGLLIDATFGRKTKSVVVMNSEHVILSAVVPETLANRIAEEGKE